MKLARLPKVGSLRQRRRPLRAAILLLCCATCGLPALFADDTGVADWAVEQSMFKLVNQERMQRDLSALKWSDKLQQAARKHSQLMMQAKRLSHRFPDEPDLMARLAATGLHFNYGAENLAYSTDAEDLHPSLMHSPGHRANILDPKSNAIGIGVINVGGKYFVTEDFATATEESTPAESEKRFAVAFNKLRAEKKMSVVQVEADKNISEAMCQLAANDKLSAASIPRPSQSMGAIAFTASQPEELPTNVVGLSGSPGLKKLLVGACFRTSPTYPGGTYWFGVLY
jgi:cysteine-rich secretory family protein